MDTSPQNDQLRIRLIVRSTVNVSIDFRWREAICARQPVTEVHARRCNASTSRICRRASTMEGKRATSNLPGIVSFTGWGRNRYRRKADNSSEAVNPFETDILLPRKDILVYIYFTLILISFQKNKKFSHPLKSFSRIHSFITIIAIFSFFKIFEKLITK